MATEKQTSQIKLLILLENWSEDQGNFVDQGCIIWDGNIELWNFLNNSQPAREKLSNCVDGSGQGGFEHCLEDLLSIIIDPIVPAGQQYP